MLLLKTKLTIPPLRPAHVQRPDLIQKLNQVRDYKLALIVASAGYGKTTLVSEWIAHRQLQVAWFSIDVGDNDSVRFWDYLIAAIQSLHPNIGEQSLALLHEPQPLPIETILSTLINEFSVLPEMLTLVLDDYQLIESSSIHEGLAFLLEHLPSQLRLIMTTRSDPPFPLARMRVRGELLELRNTDLRFSPPQIASFFADVMGLTLTTDEITALDSRVEGWIAGLQLAGLALQGKSNPSEFIASFAGDHHYVLDYLGDEILDRLPDTMQKFLLQTSVLERLNAELCDMVNGVGESYKVLEYLDRHHFFVVALDDKRQWYRYHRLFADFLQARLRLKYPNRLEALHQKASQWFEQKGLQAEAISHALAAQDYERAAELVEGIAELLIWRRAEHNTLLSWLSVLPEPVMQSYPRLYLYHAWVLHLTNQMSAAQERIHDAENALKQTVGSPEPLLAGMLAAVHSTLTGLQHQFPETLRLSRNALELLPKDAVSWRCMAAINLGVTSAYIGEIQEAVEVLSYAMDLSQEIGSSFAILSAFWHLSSLQIAQLGLRAAENTCQQLEAASQMTGLQRFPTSSYVALLLGEIHMERNQLEAAETYLLESAEQINPESFPIALLRAYLALSRLKSYVGDVVAAGHYWQLAEQLERMSKLRGRATLLSVSRARRWLAEGNLEAVEAWAAENHLGIDDEFTYHRESHYHILARFYLARRATRDKSLYLLERLVKQSEISHRNGSLIRALILQALALDLSDSRPKAIASLTWALTLADAEQPIRVFVDEGQAIAPLLKNILDLQRKGEVASSISSAYINKLLLAFGKPSSSPTTNRRPVGHRADTLSERELEVLTLLADGLESNEIAERLIIAVDTARKHIKNIYSKLGVHSRWEAIKAAEAYSLL
jgi:LuxR family transcriptional regulator, maltose regulon positive regulatory protein